MKIAGFTPFFAPYILNIHAVHVEIAKTTYTLLSKAAELEHMVEWSLQGWYSGGPNALLHQTGFQSVAQDPGQDTSYLDGGQDGSR